MDVLLTCSLCCCDLQLLGGTHKVAFTCKDKAKRMVAPVVVTVEPSGQRSMSVAEPFAVYRLPDGACLCIMLWCVLPTSALAVCPVAARSMALLA